LRSGGFDLGDDNRVRVQPSASGGLFVRSEQLLVRHRRSSVLCSPASIAFANVAPFGLS